MNELTCSEREVIDLLGSKDEPLNTLEINESLGKRYPCTYKLLWELELRGLLVKNKGSRNRFVYFSLNKENPTIKGNS